MKTLLITLASTLLALTPGPSGAAWDDTNVDNIIQDVQAVKNKVLNGDIPETAHDLKRQLDLLRGQGVFITETVPEILQWLQDRRTPLRDFLRTPRGDYDCTTGAGSQCADFRERLKAFSAEFGELRSRFPAVDRLGMGDGGFGGKFVDQAPGFVLFGLHEILERVPDWQYIPVDLADIYDEIGDADAFSLDWRAVAAVRPAARTLAKAAAGTPAERFCTNKRDKVNNPIDPVRLNRIKLGIAVLKTVVAATAEFMPDQLGADVLGEGACCAKFPFGPVLKAVASTIELIAGALETYQSNLNVCRDREREIEVDLSGCAPLLEYKLKSGNDEAYALVQRKIDEAGHVYRTVRAERSLQTAAGLRRNYDWAGAYGWICNAYQKLGED